MKSQVIFLLSVVAAANALGHDGGFANHKHKRQAPAATTSAAAAPTTSTTAAAGAPATTAAAATSAAVIAAPAGVYSIPNVGALPLSAITSGMPSQATEALASTYAPGATPPVSGAPVLPTAFAYREADWPALDKPIDTTTDEVQEWLKELDGYDIPDIPQTVDGTCASDPDLANNAATNGWWSCGGHTRPTDITVCPDKGTWGLSFDDGPSPFTPTLLNYLDSKDVLATFFVVGSRVVSYPNILIEEYMGGHEISVHTWSHPHLTTLSNEAIVAELGWTRKAIQTVLGVTPTTMRPPYGDIDDRVRAIALAMGMVPIIWSSSPATGPFDTNDWKVPGGIVTGTEAFATFQAILGNASTLETGFIVLEHDLFQETVDLAVEYFLNAALTATPPFNLEPIGTCAKIPTSNLYVESNKNASFPYPNDDTNTTSSGSGSASGSSTTKASTGQGGTSGAMSVFVPALSTLVAVGLAVLGSTML